jgi:hypothetical protein
MDEELMRRILREELAAALHTLKLELVEVCAGHMGTTYYWAVLRHGDQLIAKVCIGDDGFNDGDKLGTSLRASRRVKKESEL